MNRFPLAAALSAAACFAPGLGNGAPGTQAAGLLTSNRSPLVCVSLA
jgi:hypothetical protein